MISGPIHASTQELKDSGEAVVDAPLGPLQLAAGGVEWSGDGLRWKVTVHNPTSTRFGVTLVLTIQNDDGLLGGSDSVSFQISGGETRELARAAPAPAAPERARSWRIESWVRVLEAPDRRTLRGSS